jgi:hypothetical protein
VEGQTPVIDVEAGTLVLHVHLSQDLHERPAEISYPGEAPPELFVEVSPCHELTAGDVTRQSR